MHNSKTILPLELQGSWFRQGSDEWTLGIYDQQIVYDSDVWKIKNISRKDNGITISLYNGKKENLIYLKTGRKKQLFIGSKGKFFPISQHPAEGNSVNGHLTEYDRDKVFKQDSAVYKGLLPGYQEKNVHNTGTVFVNNIFRGVQESYPITINPDGTFYSKFPMDYAEDVSIAFPADGAVKVRTFNVFCRPGKTLFQFFDAAPNDQGRFISKSLFMGPLAVLNNELRPVRAFQTNNLSDFDLYKICVNLSPYMEKLVLSSLDFERAESTFQLRYNKTALTEADSIGLITWIRNIPLNSLANVSSGNYKHFLNILQHSVLFLVSEDLKKELLMLKENIAFSRGELDSLDRIVNKSQLLVFYNDHPKYRAEINMLCFENAGTLQVERLKNYLNIADGPALDFMQSQLYLQILDDNLLPFSQKQLNDIRKKITTPYIYNYIVGYNEKIKAKKATGLQ